MIVFLLLLATLAAGAVLGTIDAVRRDGYGPMPERVDPVTERPRLF